MNDQELSEEKVMTCIAAYQQGSIQALEELVTLTRQPVYAYALRLTASPHGAEELFQETWLKAIRNLEQFRGGRFLSWLFRITHNLHIDLVRRHKDTVSLHAPAAGSEAMIEACLADPKPGPEAHAAAADGVARIHRAVDQLPADQKMVFLMRTEGDLTFREIAATLNISINTALARMQYALTKLRRELAAEE